ncbi:LysE family translocator [Gracilibacillus caseinilyticus]|uniref:LysE family translocator n=1 Tax=Gracilibacillus caseinilyticus TaxID=2932256 RepID=A0ABY4EXD6_9BACI|nr:LysE family transporter [Gracilibacillus caseinilyticus]UOQ49075.1 LysE family translocator [Gracilibacillus caseinilyticus]
MSLFFSYLLLGVSLAAPIGPVNAAQFNQGIKNGFLHAWILGIGSILAELCFIIAIYFGMVHLLETPFAKTFLWLFGSFVLLYTGLESIMSSHQLDGQAERHSLRKTFTTGFLLSISNPLSILFWLGIYGSVLADTMEKYQTEQILWCSTAIVIGIMSWDLLMAIVSSGSRKVLPGKTLTLISIVTGLSLIGFGIYFGYQALIVIF